MKSSTGTEYVNAQAEDLKDLIDEYAAKIAEMSSGAVYGMVWFGVIYSGAHSYMVAYITGSVYQGKNRFQLHLVGGFNHEGGLNKSIDTGILEEARPASDVSLTASAWWSDNVGSGECNAKLRPDGVLEISLDGDMHGQFDAAKYYEHVEE